MCPLPLVLSLDVTEKRLPPPNEIFTNTDIRFPSQAFPSASWKVSALSASSCIKDAALPSLCPLVVLTPAHPKSLTGHSTPALVSPVLRRQEWSPPQHAALTQHLICYHHIDPFASEKELFSCICYDSGLDMLQVSVSAPNKHRPFLPLHCHSSPLLGKVDAPPVRGLQRCIIFPWELSIWNAGVAALVCAGDMQCHSPPLLAHKYSPQQQDFQKAFAHHLQKMLLWELHAGLAVKLTSLSTCWRDAYLSLLAQSSKHPLIRNSLITSCWKSQAPWLLFPDEACALTFLQEFPEIPGCPRRSSQTIYKQRPKNAEQPAVSDACLC